MHMHEIQDINQPGFSTFFGTNLSINDGFHTNFETGEREMEKTLSRNVEGPILHIHYCCTLYTMLYIALS